jgi:3-deoxy-D-manno-octulosonic acid (KDO) 8-phosphate synthase
VIENRDMVLNIALQVSLLSHKQGVKYLFKANFDKPTAAPANHSASPAPMMNRAS